jgi:hypothetical protein
MRDFFSRVFSPKKKTPGSAAASPIAASAALSEEELSYQETLLLLGKYIVS